jgi:hypothetical protein
MSEFSEDDVIHCLERLGDVTPSPDRTRRAIERVRGALQNDAPRAVPVPGGRRTLRRALRTAAAVLIAAGSLFTFGILFRGGSTLAFAQVAQRFREAHTLAYQMSVDTAKVKGSLPVPADRIPATVTQQIYLKEPGRGRTEGPAGQISIAHWDRGQSKILGLNPIAKQAVLWTGKSTKQPSRQTDPMRMVEELRQLAEKNAHPGGVRRIGDVDAQGFRVRMEQEEWLVWADPKTRLPVLVEFTLSDGTRCTLSEFRFNPELDDDLFSLEVPKGYKLVPVEVEDLTGEENLVRMLRFYAETSGGKFPKRVDDSLGIMGHLIRTGQDKKEPSSANMRVSAYIVRSGMFISTLKGGFGYRPDGAKLGDAGRVLFWYRPPEAAKWRTLYADLHWAELTTDQLPEKPNR